jgi:hypothetical protein
MAPLPIERNIVGLKNFCIFYFYYRFIRKGMKTVLINSGKFFIWFSLVYSLCEANQVPIESPVPTIEPEGQYVFTPIASIVGLGFIAVSFLILTIAKIINSNSDHYMANNRYDLIIFKPPTKNSNIGRVYSNNTANAHNLSAATACGFDFSLLDAFRLRNQNTQSLASNN